MSSGNQAKRARVALSQSSLARAGQLLTVSHRKLLIPDGFPPQITNS